MTRPSSVACEIAMTAFNVPRCIANVNNPKNGRIFHEVGIEPVSSTELIARMVEEGGYCRRYAHGVLAARGRHRDGRDEVSRPPRCATKTACAWRISRSRMTRNSAAVIRDDEFVDDHGRYGAVSGRDHHRRDPSSDAEEEFRRSSSGVHSSSRKISTPLRSARNGRASATSGFRKLLWNQSGIAPDLVRKRADCRGGWLGAIRRIVMSPKPKASEER